MYHVYSYISDLTLQNDDITKRDWYETRLLRVESYPSVVNIKNMYRRDTASEYVTRYPILDYDIQIDTCSLLRMRTCQH